MIIYLKYVIMWMILSKVVALIYNQLSSFVHSDSVNINNKRQGKQNEQSMDLFH